jgi:uncharacterized protein
MAPDDSVLRELLRTSRTIAVVGLSDDPSRASFGVAAYLQRAGYRILPVNPKLAGATVLGETAFARLEDIALAIDIVDVFRRAEDMLPVATSAVAIKARCLWQQLGIHDEASHRMASAAGLVSVSDRCLLVEHRRLAP